MKNYICGDSFSSNNIDSEEVYNSNKRKFSNLKRHQLKHVSCYSFYVSIWLSQIKVIFSYQVGINGWSIWNFQQNPKQHIPEALYRNSTNRHSSKVYIFIYVYYIRCMK